MAKKLYTIGYAGFPDIGVFLQTLKQYGVQILIDVRSSPYSTYYEAYNKDRLSAMLNSSFRFAVDSFLMRQRAAHFQGVPLLSCGLRIVNLFMLRLYARN